MRRPARAVLIACGLALAAAGCSSGSTEVQGIGDGATGEATGPTAPTGATPTGATGATGATATSGLEGAVSMDVGSFPIQGVQEVAFFSCDGVFGTWTYIFKADFGQGISFDIDTEVDLSSGSGTLVFGDEFNLAGAGTVGWEDTVDLEIAGTPEAPTIRSTRTTVDLTGSIEGFPVDLFKTFPENQEFPIVAGSDRC